MKAPERTIIPPEGLRPGAAPSEPRRRTAALTAIAMLVGALVGGGAVLAWERVGRSDADRALEQALDQRDEALREVDALTTRVTALRGRLSAATDETVVLQAALDRARGRLTGLLGPALEDGRHFGYLTAVGASQEPPRLVLDLAVWFTDQEAIEAALEDGVPREDAGINGYYIRNESPRWRILSIDPDATVVLSTYPVADPAHPVEVTLDRFAELFASSDGYLPLSPYWLTIRNGVVVTIEEQFVP
jgi:hypothetical protein